MCGEVGERERESEGDEVKATAARKTRWRWIRPKDWSSSPSRTRKRIIFSILRPDDERREQIIICISMILIIIRIRLFEVLSSSFPLFRCRWWWSSSSSSSLESLFRVSHRIAWKWSSQLSSSVLFRLPLSLFIFSRIQSLASSAQIDSASLALILIT